MKLEGLMFYLFIFIIGPIVRGLLESGKTKKKWQERQLNQTKTEPTLHETPEMGSGSMPGRNAGTGRRRALEKPRMRRPAVDIPMVKTKSAETFGMAQQDTGQGTVAAVSAKPSIRPAEDFRSCENINLKNLDSQDLLKGIIFSQILGPPKSLARGR